MYKIYFMKIKLVILVVYLGSIISCTVEMNEQQNLTPILQPAFDSIYLARHSLEFPHTKSDLNRCSQYKNNKCLTIYDRVMEAKNTILSLSASNALDATLDIIEKTCLSKDEKIANITCYGGIMSLYFYYSPEQDAKIIARVKKYPKKVRNIIFNNEFFWHYNRPDSNVWIDYISVADVEWDFAKQKQYIADMFRRSFDEVDNEPWVLR